MRLFGSDIPTIWGVNRSHGPAVSVRVCPCIGGSHPYEPICALTYADQVFVILPALSGVWMKFAPIFRRT